MPTRFEASQFREVLRESARILHKTVPELLQGVAKGFTKDMIAVSPPASQGAAGRDAKKQGEQSVELDYARVFRTIDENFVRYMLVLSGRGFGTITAKEQGTAREERWIRQVMGYVRAKRMSAIEKMFRDLGVHRQFLDHVTKALADSFRSQNTGRMSAKNLYAVLPGAVREPVTAAKKNVGALAGGWNPAAAKLGAARPGYVKRHTSIPGSIHADADGGGKYRIEIENASRYIGNIPDYEDRREKVMGWQVPKLERQMDFLMRRDLKRAGWA
jgi:hypothetical protein